MVSGPQGATGAVGPVTPVMRAAPIIATVQKETLPAGFAKTISGAPQVATMVSMESNGRATVNIGGQLLTVKFPLPNMIKTGDQFSILLRLGGEFSTAEKTITSDPGRPFSNNSALPSANQSTPVTISRPGELITNVINSAVAKGLAPYMSVAEDLRNVRRQISDLNGRSMIVHGSEARGLLIASLADFIFGSVDRSGVFYESHLKDWLAGRRTLSQIKKEPQNFLSIQSGYEDGITEIPLGGDKDKLSSLVSNQINALLTGKFQIVLEGLFPYPVELNFEREFDDADSRQFPGAKSPWVVNIKMYLEQLGLVEGKVRVHEDVLDLQIACSPPLHEILTKTIPGAREDLAQAGVVVNSISVKVHELYV